MKTFYTLAIMAVLAGVSLPARAAYVQQGNKLVGTGNVGNAIQGGAVSLSADGNTMIFGGITDNGTAGAAWVFTRSAGVWTQQGLKLVGTPATATAQQGYSVAVSGDGNMALIGGPIDTVSLGAVWVFTRSGGVWTQEAKLQGSGNVSANCLQGISVALSSDGNTALVGASGEGGNVGAVWVFTRSGGVWTQQAGPLTGTGSVGNSLQGNSVALSSDGNTALVGGPADATSVGATWVFTRTAGVWTQQGAKLIGTGATGGASRQGCSVSLSSDGNTAVIGGNNDNAPTTDGAVWVFTRSGGVWTQQGAKLVGTGGNGTPQQGNSVSVSPDGNTLVSGGLNDFTGTGAAWIFTRSGGVWTQQGAKLVGTGATGNANQGVSVSLSGNGNFVMGGNADNSNFGAVWTFAFPASKLAVTSVNGGTAPFKKTAFSVTAQAQDSLGNVTPVASDTALSLAVTTGTGTLSGTNTATILNGTASIALGALQYSKGEAGVVLTATRTSGDALTDGVSAPFAVTNRPPSIASGPTATPSTAGVGQTVTFGVAATDADNDTLTYTWNVDGVVLTGAAPTHAFTAAGTYTADLTVSDGDGGTATGSVQVIVKAPTAGTGNDSDGDGFSDSFETAAGSSASDATSTPFGNGQAAPTPQALAITKLVIKLDFSTPTKDKDSITLTGTLPVPDAFDPTDKKVTVDVGGVNETLTLNAKGKSVKQGPSDPRSFKVTLKAKNKVVVANPAAKFTASLKKDDYSAALADEGLTGEAEIKLAQERQVQVTLLFNGGLFQKLQTQLYTAKANKNGSTKMPKVNQ